MIYYVDDIGKDIVVGPKIAFEKLDNRPNC
jgi:hypothetical protein